MLRQTRFIRTTAAAIALAFVVGACGSGQPSAAGSAVSSTSAAASTSAAPSASAGASAAPASTPPPRAKVRLALDWTPNTNHTGVFVAKAKGWYDDAAIDLDVLPYGTTAPEALLAAHQADCGISFQDSLTFAVASGAQIVSVMAILQHAASEISVLDDSGITRPKELDGKTYGAFGYPNEQPTVRSVIQHDGGKGTFQTVTLDTAAYEALYAKRVDFTITFRAWEGIQAANRNIKLRYFAFTDYGFPDFYQVVLACDRQWLDRNPDAAKRFVGATVRGYELAASDPNLARDLLIGENQDTLLGERALVDGSTHFLADGHYYTDENGKVGTQTLAKWQGYSGFLFDQGLLTDVNGKKLTSAPDYASLFTNDYLP